MFDIKITGLDEASPVKLSFHLFAITKPMSFLAERQRQNW